ncbi:MAG: DNA adenine methylase [Myxococcota bacterium]|nr:DNA adenine methylase [Myxococcota bacterium]
MPIDFISPKRIPRPFVKWAGGKTQILSHLRRKYPPHFKRYHEPFLGGGAVFFDLKAASASISDANAELINCYQVVKTEVDALIEALSHYVYQKEQYYAVRDWDPETLDPVKRAARTIYLNRTGFNGLYRVNSSGKFNVPFGRYKNPTICDAENLRACAQALEGTSICTAGFEEVLASAEAGDFVYFDPPYIPVSDTAYFTAYQKRGFGMDNQERLAEVFDALAKRGVAVMLSNADVPWMHERYGRYNIQRIQAKRSVNSNTKRRGEVGEVIVTNH